MTRFRVQNYKKVRDTGWISCQDVTVLVGKNESGKSSIFRGLSKLNPSDLEKYDSLKEFPRRRYASEFKTQDWAVASVEFNLTPDEKKILIEHSPILKDVTSVICTRHYSWALDFEFIPKPELPNVSNQMFLTLIVGWQKTFEEATAPEEKGDALASMKTKLLPFISQKIEQLRNAPPQTQVSEQIVTEVANTVFAQMNENWQKEIFKKVIDEIGHFRSALATIPQLNNAMTWLQNNLPKFVYFDRYDVIDSAIHFPTFIQQLKNSPSAPRVRSTKALFQHVGLDLVKLMELDPTQPNKAEKELRRFADERAILMSSASDAITQKFSEWWEQRRHRFRYQADGPFFRVWVSDDLDPSEIELDQRSAGMQYFFSFYLVFLEEAKGAYSNSILLLDEAGLQLHGTAQQKIIKFLEKLSIENQLLYTTHSPFLIDGDHLERVRVVYEDQVDGTAKVSEDVWPKDKDSLFPLQAALGYAIAQTLFYSKRQLVVEGITDYWILKAISECLDAKGRESLRRDAIIVPSGGVKNLMPLAAMLLGHEVEIRILLDGDEPGLQKGKELKSKLLLESFFVNTYTKNNGVEIEDLFPEQYYLKAVNGAYPTISFKFNKEESQIPSITKRVETAFARISSVQFEKWRPIKILVDNIQNKPEEVPNDTLDAFELFFKDVNESWGKIEKDF
jgi:predicted ATP-dependent endonuclease of OLD family